MSFTSGIFLLFFAVLLVVYYLIPRRHQWKLLLLASYLFYAFAGWSAVCYLLATTVTTWLSARQIGKHYGVQAQWLAEHAADYGFILRYPSDKTEATGMDYEPWHYRYVGSEQAHKIKESGLCLEEYLAQ